MHFSLIASIVLFPSYRSSYAYAATAIARVLLPRLIFWHESGRKERGGRSSLPIDITRAAFNDDLAPLDR